MAGQAYITIDDGSGTTHLISYEENKDVINTLLAGSLGTDDISEELSKFLNMGRRITINLVTKGSGITPVQGESRVDESTGDVEYSVVDISDGSLKILTPIKDLRNKLDAYERAGVTSFLQATSDNAEVNFFTFDGDIITFDKFQTFPIECRYYTIFSYATKSISDPEYADIIPTNYSTLGEYYAALAEYEPVPVLGEVADGKPSVNNGNHTSIFVGVENGIPLPAKAISAEVLNANRFYKLTMYDVDLAQFGRAKTFSAMDILSPAIIRTQAYDYRVMDLAIITDRDSGNEATLMQGEDPYSVTANFFLGFSAGAPKNITSALGDKLIVKYTDMNDAEVFPYDANTGKYDVNTLGMSIGTRFKMKVAYTISKDGNMTVDDAVITTSTGEATTMYEEKIFNIVEDKYDRNLSLLPIPYKYEADRYRLKTFVLSIDGSVRDVTDSLILPNASEEIPKDGTDHAKSFILKQGFTSETRMDIIVNFATVAANGLLPNAYKITAKEMDSNGVGVVNPTMIFGLSAGGKYYDNSLIRHIYKSVPICAQISTGDMRFWMDPADYTEFVGTQMANIGSAIKNEGDNNYQTALLPTHFSIRSVKDSATRYIAPQPIATLTTNAFLLPNRFSDAQNPAVSDSLLIELYREDVNTGMKAIGILPAYIVNAVFNTSAFAGVSPIAVL